MKIILISIGTRGDMEPFLPIGNLLRERGHTVICSFPEQFRHLAENPGLEFFSLGTEFIEMLESDDGKAALGGSGSGFKRFIANVRLAFKQTDINKALVKRQFELIEREKPDRIIYNGKVVYPILWEIKHLGQTIMLSPIPYMHYVKGHTHVAFNSNFGKYLNKLTFSFANFGMITILKITKKWLKMQEHISRNMLKKVLFTNKAIYTISPSLFSKPDYWRENLKVVGFHKCSSNLAWNPNHDLVDFLEIHKDKRILYITFGSMTNPIPDEKTEILIRILERNQIPVIIGTASGGLVEPAGFRSDNIHFEAEIPYEWIFPKVYGVIHHGGSGTTHLGLKYGCATMIIPHIIDQFVWNNIIHDLGVGPKGIKIGKIKSENLEPKILDLVTNDFYKIQAGKLASQMEKESLSENLYNSICE